MSIRTVASAIMALVAFLLVAFAPAGAAAHGSVPHMHAAKHVSDGAAVKPAVAAVQAELRAQMPALPDMRTDAGCDRGCCASGHCSALWHGDCARVLDCLSAVRRLTSW